MWMRNCGARFYDRPWVTANNFVNFFVSFPIVPIIDAENNVTHLNYQPVLAHEFGHVVIGSMTDGHRFEFTAADGWLAMDCWNFIIFYNLDKTRKKILSLQKSIIKRIFLNHEIQIKTILIHLSSVQILRLLGGYLFPDREFKFERQDSELREEIKIIA